MKANKLNDVQNRKIEDFENQMKLKDKEITDLKTQFKNIKINENDEGKKYGRKEMQCVYFTSTDQTIHYPVPCIGSDIFAEVEEKLYKQYPEYRETNNCFISNGKEILRFKSISDNKIGNGVPVILYEQEK